MLLDVMFWEMVSKHCHIISMQISVTYKNGSMNDITYKELQLLWNQLSTYNFINNIYGGSDGFLYYNFFGTQLGYYTCVEIFLSTFIF